jgi:hypothetical protein
MPITRKEFERRSINLEKDIVDFLSAHRDRAYTSEEIMGATSFHTEFDLVSAPEITVFIVANFVAFINDLAARGRIRRKVVNNRMYFTAVDVKFPRVSKKKRIES